MLSRRALLKFVAITAGLRVSSALGTPARAAHPVFRVATSGRCTDTRCFRGALGGVPLCLDVGAENFIAELAAALAASDTGLVAGLSRDSDFVLVTQLALERGFSPGFKGEHRYRDGVVEHRLETDGATAQVLRRTLLASGPNWPASLAQSLPTIAVAGGAARATRFEMPAQRPADSPGYLLSWTFGRLTG